MEHSPSKAFSPRLTESSTKLVDEFGERGGAFASRPTRFACAVRWIARENPAAARALRNAVAKAARRIARHVLIGSLRLDLADDRYRFLTLTGFSYVIIYNSASRPPLIVRILHGETCRTS